MATEADIIDQQRRVVTETRQDIASLLDILGRLDQRAATYVRLGLGDDQILETDAFVGTGTGVAEYRGAITSIGAIQTLLAAGHGTNLEKFSR